MRHSRSIDLNPPDGKILPEFQHITFEDLAGWMALLARCSKCGNTTELYRPPLERKFGRHAQVAPIAARLKCASCGNREDNRLLLYKMPR